MYKQSIVFALFRMGSSWLINYLDIILRSTTESQGIELILLPDSIGLITTITTGEKLLLCLSFMIIPSSSW